MNPGNVKSGRGTTNFAVVESTEGGDSVLHHVLKRPALGHKSAQSDYKASLDVLMVPERGSDAFDAEISRVINHKDELKCAPLHYATQQWDQDTVR